MCNNVVFPALSSPKNTNLPDFLYSPRYCNTPENHSQRNILKTASLLRIRYEMLESSILSDYSNCGLRSQNDVKQFGHAYYKLQEITTKGYIRIIICTSDKQIVSNLYSIFNTFMPITTIFWLSANGYSLAGFLLCSVLSLWL